MKQLSIYASVAVVAAAVLPGCSTGHVVKVSGPMVSQSVSATDFQKLDVSSVFDVEVKSGNEYSVSLNVPESLLPHLVAKAEGGVLTLGFNCSVNISSDKYFPKAVVTMPSLSAVSTSGQSSVHVGCAVNDAFAVSTSGQSDVKFVQDITLNSLSVSSSGQSDVDLKDVMAQEVSLSTSGQSDIDFGKIVAAQFTAHSSGQSDISGASAVVTQGHVSSSGQSSISVKHTEGNISQSSSGQSDITLGR